MGFTAPLHDLSDYLKWTMSGHIQLPDFQRGYKWEDERVRSLLVTILRGHPLGIVMLLETGNDQVRFKPRPIEGVALDSSVDPSFLLLDGQQRLTSLTQALTEDGIVATKDDRGKALDRRYYVNIPLALAGDDRIDEAIISVPADGMRRTNFGRDIELDVSTPEKEQANRLFPLRLLYRPYEAFPWLNGLDDMALSTEFMAKIITPAASYRIPAIELDRMTDKSAVATVFEKVNTGGLALSVFELLTSTFAGDRAYFEEHGHDFRLNDDWHEIQAVLHAEPVLRNLENTDFLQAITLLATRARNLADNSNRPPAISAKREDVLKLTLNDYLAWREPVRDAFQWAATFMADQHIFDVKFLPYPKQLVPLAAIRAVLGRDADLHGVKQRLAQWFWCGILGELYGGASETRFVRDIEQVPGWARGESEALTPRTVVDGGFQESRLYSLRTRNAAAYKGIYILLLQHGARDWMNDQAFDKVQYAQLSVDIHHVFPYKWCLDNNIDMARRESIVNKTPLSAQTNRTIGGQAPSKYLQVIENKARISDHVLDALVATHAVNPGALRVDDFDAHFSARKEALIVLIEAAMGKPVQRVDKDADVLAEARQFEVDIDDVRDDEDAEAA